MQQIELNVSQIFITEGARSTIGANNPVLLNDPESVWLVEAGKVEIFAVRMRKGQPSGARNHVCSVGPGEVFFGMDSDMYGNGLVLLAVGIVNTQLLRLPLERLKGLTRQQSLSEAIVGLIDQWVMNLALDLTEQVLVPKTEVLLEKDGEMELDEQQEVAAKKNPVWLKLTEGRLLLLGEEEIEAPACIPLYSRIWLRGLEKSRGQGLDTAQVIAGEADLWQSLDLFYDLFFRVKFTNIGLGNFDEINRLRQKAEYDRELGEDAWSYLYGVLQRGRSQLDLDEARKAPLLAACRLVGEKEGITIQAPPPADEKASSNDVLQNIAKASRVQIRRVRLEPNWWRNDNGALVGFLVENNQPVALLPLSPRRYTMVEPATGAHTEITRSVAARLLNEAYFFYRPLPEKPLRPLELLKFALRGCAKDIAVALGLGLAMGLLTLVVPLVTGYIFGTVIPIGTANPQDKNRWFGQMFAALLVLAVAAGIFQVTLGVAILRVQVRIGSAVQTGVWQRLMGMPLTFFRQYSAGDLTNRANSIDNVRRMFSISFVSGTLSSFFALFNFGLLLTYDRGLAFLVLGLVLVNVLITTLTILSQRRQQQELTALQGKIAGLVLELIGGIAKLRVAGAEVRAFAVWAKEFAKQRKLNFQLRANGNLLTAFNTIWPILSSMFIFALMTPESNGVGRFLLFFSAYGQFLASALVLSSNLLYLFQTWAILERARPILENAPETDTTKVNPGELSGAIEINHVSFKYDKNAPYVLQDVSLRVKPGEFVAIVGPSGSGKSSLFRLLLGFEKPEAGSIYYDNQDLAGLDMQAVRRQFGVVIQNGKLAAGDIFTNIVGSGGSFSIEDAWKAARMAGLEDDIKQMPMGMYTVVSEGGSNLSGGQAQRLMIARAVVNKPRILLFDEATSALDNRTQAIVSQSLESLKATRIVIAHRLSTIINADSIYVLMNGKFVQQGKYAELMAQDGPFRDLVMRQQA